MDIKKVGAAIIIIFIAIAAPVWARDLYYATAPLEWFVKIESIEARQINSETILSILYREVKVPITGQVSRKALCVEDDPDEEVFTKTSDLTFDKKTTNKAEVKIPVADFPRDCHNFQFEVQYVAIMPNGDVRLFDLQYSNIFRIVFPGEDFEDTIDNGEATITPLEGGDPIISPKKVTPEDKGKSQQSTQGSSVNITNSNSSQEADKKEDAGIGESIGKGIDSLGKKAEGILGL